MTTAPSASADAPLAELLRACRARLGLSQAGLARRWGMSLKTLQAVEHGRPSRALDGPLRRLAILETGSATEAPPDEPAE